MELSKVLLQNYLPYAKATIISRAIPSIDGFKPVQRRLLYTMNKMGLANGDKVKSQKIDGQTMSIHPHGDSSIYEAMVLMTTGYEGMNVPFIESKGSFGKKYSRDLQYAAPRYTEAKLAPISKELFESINENAIDFIDNYDGSEKEPTLLPTKFPNILVNSSTGVAVGKSSNIPSFSLKNVCEATIGVIKGTINTHKELAQTLGVPEFTTGGMVHASEESLEKLCATGRGSFTVSGRVVSQNDTLVITEIPYTTTAEDIMDAIEEAIKNKELRGIRDVRDEIGLEGLRIVVEIKSGYSPREVYNELCRLTPLRASVSYNTRVIVGNRCKDLNIMELINHWIEFRKGCIDRIYKFRLDKLTADEHLESTWEKIKDDIKGAVNLIASNTEEEAIAKLKSTYGLDDVQAEYLMDMKIKSITTDRAKTALNKLAEIREKIKYCNSVISNDDVKKNIIVDELNEISAKYGRDNRTVQVDEIVVDKTKTTVKISDENVVVVLTEAGYLRRLTSLRDIAGTFVARNGDKEIRRWAVKNNGHILVFDIFGTVHKILVDNIDASSRGTLTDKILDMANIEKFEHIVWIDAAGDYSGYFNLIYPNGRGRRVPYSAATGNRAQYKGLYDPVEPRSFFLTNHDKFFLITAKKKAAYCDISHLGMMSSREAFKVARVSSGDYFCRLVPEENVPDISKIDKVRYWRGYTVCIGSDVLYEEPGEKSKENSGEDQD